MQRLAKCQAALAEEGASSLRVFEYSRGRPAQDHAVPLPSEGWRVKIERQERQVLEKSTICVCTGIVSPDKQGRSYALCPKHQTPPPGSCASVLAAPVATRKKFQAERHHMIATCPHGSILERLPPAFPDGAEPVAMRQLHAESGLRTCPRLCCTEPGCLICAEAGFSSGPRRRSGPLVRAQTRRITRSTSMENLSAPCFRMRGPGWAVSGPRPIRPGRRGSCCRGPGPARPLRWNCKQTSRVTLVSPHAGACGG